MSKISLREVKLINWYGFVNETIPLSDHMTLITGENESGKSTILDAIKYAYTGMLIGSQRGYLRKTGR